MVTTPKKMRAIVFDYGDKWTLEEVDVPTPGPKELLLKVVRTGVCGTDEHLLHGGFIAKFPLIPGHEILGEVVEVGSEVTGAELGDMVAVDNATACGDCENCVNGRSLFCDHFHSLGCNAPGGFAEYVVVRASKCFEVNGMDPELAGLAEPTACAVHGLDTIQLPPAADVLVFGAGPTGLILAQLLRHSGASRVVVAAPTRSKLDLALSLGIDEVVQMDRKDSRAAERQLKCLAPRGFDLVVEATGVPSVLELAMDLTAAKANVVVYGVAKEDATAKVKPYEIFAKELTIKGSYAQIDTLGRAVRLLKSGAVRSKGIVTDIVGFDDFQRALDNLKNSEQCKTVFEPK